jgi:hypothetical protein
MPDETIMDNLQLIIKSIDLISSRFSKIDHPDDLVSSESGVIILDAIAMRLQVIGELLKKIDKKDHSFLKSYATACPCRVGSLYSQVNQAYET